LTVLFSDIRGFTAYSEVREPESVVAMLNQMLRLASLQARSGQLGKAQFDRWTAALVAEVLEHRRPFHHDSNAC
jgi:hypothetical protein